MNIEFEKIIIRTKIVIRTDCKSARSEYIPALKQNFVLDQNTSREALTNVTETDYQYKYNGKEFQDELGLNMYSMDMRMYDPAIARWVVQDPVIHFEFSPYNAFDNNPVYWADPSGADAVNVGYDRVVDSKDISGSATWSGGFQKIQDNGKDINNGNSYTVTNYDNSRPKNGEPKSGGEDKNKSINSNKDRLKFSKGKTQFRIQEVGVTYASGGAVSEGKMTITSTKGYYFENQEIVSEGISFGIGASALQGSLFSASSGFIVFDKPLQGSTLLEVFSTTESVEVSSFAIFGLKISKITGLSSSGDQLWHSYGKGGEGNVLSATILKGGTEWNDKKQPNNNQKRYETINNNR